MADPTDRPEGTAGRLLLLLRQFTVETERFVEDMSKRHGLHRTDLNALNVLSQASRSGQPITPGRLGEELRLSSPATTALIDRLDRAGHVHRERNPRDRRQVSLAMTDSAQSTGGAMFAPLAREIGAVIAGHTEDELAVVTRFLEEAVAATERARKSGTATDPSGRADMQPPAPLM